MTLLPERIPTHATKVLYRLKMPSVSNSLLVVLHAGQTSSWYFGDHANKFFDSKYSLPLSLFQSIFSPPIICLSNNPDISEPISSKDIFNRMSSRGKSFLGRAICLCF